MNKINDFIKYGFIIAFAIMIFISLGAYYFIENNKTEFTGYLFVFGASLLLLVYTQIRKMIDKEFNLLALGNKKILNVLGQNALSDVKCFEKTIKHIDLLIEAIDTKTHKKSQFLNDLITHINENNNLGLKLENENCVINYITKATKEVTELKSKNLEYFEKLQFTTTDINSLNLINIAKLQSQRSLLRLSSVQKDLLSFVSRLDNLTELNKAVSKTAIDTKININETTKSVEEMKSSIEETVEVTNDLVSSVNETKKVVNVIKDLSKDITILAMNAEIESARAGEVGKGFAVVAQQVRNLALKTADATEDIEYILESLEDNTGDIEKMFKKTENKNETVHRTLKDLVVNLNELIDKGTLIKKDNELLSRDISITQMEINHMKLKTITYNSFFSGKKDRVESEEECSFGQWYSSSLNPFSHHKEFEDLGKPHTLVHVTLNQVQEQIKSNYKPDEIKKIYEKLLLTEENSFKFFDIAKKIRDKVDKESLKNNLKNEYETK